jgi:hypothetical protein
VPGAAILKGNAEILMLVDLAAGICACAYPVCEMSALKRLNAAIRRVHRSFIGDFYCTPISSTVCQLPYDCASTPTEYTVQRFKLPHFAISFSRGTERNTNQGLIRQIRSPHSCELPASMSAPEWQMAIPTGNLVATYRGIRIVIKLGENGNPLEIGWYIGGQVEESVPVSCDLEWAKKMAVDVIDERIPEDEVWQQAEKKDREPDLS